MICARPYNRHWTALVSVAVLYNLVIPITRVVLPDLQSYFWTFWIVLDCVTDTVYIIDTVVQSHAGYLENGILVMDQSLRRRHYFTSRRFKLAALSLLPTDLFYLIPPATANRPYLRLNRVLRAQTLTKYLDQSELSANHPVPIRIASVLMYVVLVLHWNACLYIQISAWIGFGSDGWVYGNSENDYGFRSLTNMYLYAYYWSTLTLTTIGNLPHPETNLEYIVLTLEYLVGILFFASIIGNFSSIIKAMNETRTSFEAKREEVKQYMDKHGLCSEIQDKVIRWFDYIRSERQSVVDEEGEDGKILYPLPETVRAEIAMSIHLDALQRVSLFDNCETGLLSRLVVSLRLCVYSPGDYVCREGDVGTEMYIVKQGLLDVVCGDPRTTNILATLSEGNYFGEVSLLNIPGNLTGNRRAASVISRGYSDLFVLSKNDLWKALEEFPLTKSLLLEAGRERLRSGGWFDEEAAARAAEGVEGGGEAVDGSEGSRGGAPARLLYIDNRLMTISSHLDSLGAEIESTTAKLLRRVNRLE